MTLLQQYFEDIVKKVIREGNKEIWNGDSILVTIAMPETEVKCKYGDEVLNTETFKEEVARWILTVAKQIADIVEE